MHRGYFKFWRKYLDDLIQHPEALQLWIWCLDKASHCRRKQIIGSSVVETLPGQLVFGRHMAVRELGSTERKVRTLLELLKKLGYLTVKPSNKFSLITVMNFDSWQQDDQQDDQQTSSKRPANDHEEELRIKNLNTPLVPPASEGLGRLPLDDSPSSVPRSADTRERPKGLPRPPARENTKQAVSGDSDEFEAFWREYPRKCSKQFAEKTWKKLKKKGELPELSTLIGKLKILCRSEQWLKSEGGFIPYPATWLNAHGWLDEVTVNNSAVGLSPRKALPDKPDLTPEQRAEGAKMLEEFGRKRWPGKFGGG